MKRYDIVIRPEAENDLREAFAYIQADSRRSAASWLSGLYKAIGALETMPQRCPSAPEREDLGFKVRQFLYRSHRILFTIESSKVFVHHIRHAAMDSLTHVRAIGKRRTGRKR